MKEPARLIDASTDPELVRLLRAGRNETPSDHALRRTLQAVGVGSGVAASGLAAAAQNATAVTNGSAATLSTSAASSSVGLVASTSVTATGAAVTGAASSAGTVSVGTVGAKLIAATGIAKWAGLGALTAASATLVPDAVEWVRNTNQAVPVQVVAVEGAPRPATREDTSRKLPARTTKLEHDPHVGEPAAPPIPEAKPGVLEPNTVNAVVHRGVAVQRDAVAHPNAVSAPNPLVEPGRSTKGRAASDFAEQVELVEQARRAIAQSDAARGLLLLSNYEGRYARSQLLPEVLVLRLEALVQEGREDEARAVARRILQQGTTGAHAKRARAVLGE